MLYYTKQYFGTSSIFGIYNIIEQVCVCVSVQPFEKINATGVASVEPGKAREWIGVANLLGQSKPNEVSPNEVRQIKFHQMKFTK